MESKLRAMEVLKPHDEEEHHQQTEEEEEALLRQVLSGLGSSSSMQALDRLVYLSRFQPQRCLLASLHAVPLLLSALSQLLLPSDCCSSACISIQGLRLLSLLLKLLRNLCAGEAPNQQAFLDCNGVESVASVFRELSGVSGNEDLATCLSAILLRQPSERCQRHTKELESPCRDDPSQIRSCIVNVFQMALQLLGNVSGGGEAQKEAIWKTFVPTISRSLALTREEKILEPLCMVIYTCSFGNRLRLTDLCRGEGAALLSACLITAIRSGVSRKGVDDWLYLLVSQLCLTESLFPVLFTNLLDPSVVGAHARESSPHRAETIFCSEQAALLDMLCLLLSEKQEAWSRGCSFDLQEDNMLPMPSVSIGSLAEIIRTASKFCDPGSPYLNRPCGIPSIDVLGYALEIIKILSAWECDRKQNIESPIVRDIKEGESTRSSILAELLSHGVIRLCIELLQDIGPPELICRAMKKDGKVDLAAGHRIEAAYGTQNFGMPTQSTLETGEAQESDHTKSDLAAEYAKMKTARLPYQGYRKDLVAVIGNTSHQSLSVQDEVRKLGGLPLILQQCVVDEENPFLREWGLWAIRNLLGGNEENSKEISEMQLKGSFTPVELTQMGMKVEMDPLLGRPKLVIAPP